MVAEKEEARGCYGGGDGGHTTADAIGCEDDGCHDAHQYVEVVQSAGYVGAAPDGLQQSQTGVGGCQRCRQPARRVAEPLGQVHAPYSGTGTEEEEDAMAVEKPRGGEGPQTAQPHDKQQDGDEPLQTAQQRCGDDGEQAHHHEVSDEPEGEAGWVHPQLPQDGGPLEMAVDVERRIARDEA